MGYRTPDFRKPEPPRNNVNWDVWRLKPGGGLWEVVALSLGISPADVSIGEEFYSHREDLLTHSLPQDYKDRLDVAASRIGKDPRKDLLAVPPDSRRVPLECSYVALGDFARFANIVKWDRPPEFPPPALESEPHRVENTWPWGTYQTKLLGHLAAAVQEFWTRYDPAKPQTAPTNEKVEKWLKAQGVEAARVREIMVQIIRADDAPRGPRPSS